MVMEKWVWVLVVGGMAGTAYPQAGERFERRMEVYRRETSLRAVEGLPVERRALVDYGGYFIPSYLSLDDPLGNNHVLRQYDVLGYARVNIDSAQEFFVLGRYSYYDFAPGDSFDGRGDDHRGRLDRAFYTFNLTKFFDGEKVIGDYDISATGGRQLVYWGNGLALSREIDGAVASLGAGIFTLELVGGVTPEDAVDFDSTRPRFDEDTHRGFFGAMLSARVGQHRPYVYALAQRDYNKEDVSVSGAVTTRYEYDSNYFGIGSRGPVTDRLVYGVELTAETGSSRSNSFEVGAGGLTQVPQTDQDIEAFAADLQLDYLFGDERKTRLSAEGLISTGDQDRFSTNNTFGGNRPGTADHAFNGFGLLNTGFVFAAPVSNLMVGRLGVSTFPFVGKGFVSRLQVGGDALVFAKTQEDAPIDEGTREDTRYLGWEPDLFLNWQMTEDVTLAVRYGVFFPGTAISGDDSVRQGFFVSVSYAF
jgi:hypothetical protein